MSGERWPYPVALAWERASRSLAADHDSQSHYKALESVWIAVQRQLAFYALAAVTPACEGAPSIPLDELSRPSLGTWKSLIDAVLGSADARVTESLDLLVPIYLDDRPIPAALELIGSLEAAVGTPPPRKTGRGELSLQGLMENLVWLRNRIEHAKGPAWTNERFEPVVTRLRPCVEELLDWQDLRETLGLHASEPEGLRVDLQGAHPLSDRGAASFWLSALLTIGPDTGVDLTSIVGVASCPRCDQIELVQLEELVRGGPSRGWVPGYACITCGCVLKRPAWSGGLNERLAQVPRGVPRARLPRRHFRGTVGTPVRVAVEVFNSLRHPLAEVHLEAELADDLDLQGETPTVELRPRRSARLELGLVSQGSGRFAVRPALRWRKGEEIDFEELELPSVTLEVRSQPRALVGRARELQSLRDALGRAEHGMGSVVVVAGEEGVGRSTLLEAFCRERTDDAVVLMTACERDDLRPRQPLVQLVTKYARYYLDLQEWDLGGGLKDVLDFSGDLMDAITAVADHAELDIRSVRTAPAPGLTEQQLDELAALALNELISAVGGDHAAVVLCIDDMQLAHPRTVRLLQSVANGIARRRLLLVLGDGGTAVSQDRDRLEQLLQGADQQIALHPFAPDETREFIELLFPGNLFTDEFHRRILETTQGHPRFVSEMAEALIVEGHVKQAADGAWICATDPSAIDLPDALADVIERRLARLPKDYLEVVQRAAVLGRRFPSELLEAALREERGRDLEVRDRLRLAQMLGELDQTYRVIRDAGRDREFSHQRLWYAAYNRLGSEARRLLHQLVSDHLERHRAPSLERDLLVAEHAIAAGQVERAVHWTVDVAERLMSQNRFEEAHGLLQKAIGMGDEAGPSVAAQVEVLQEQAARAAHRVGRLRDAIALDNVIAERARARNDHGKRATSLLAQAEGHLGLEELAQASELLTLAAESARAAGLGRIEVTAQARQAAILQALGAEDDANRVATECLERCEQVPGTDGVRADCLLTLARRAHERGAFAEALAHAQQAKKLYEARHDLDAMARADYALSWFFEACGDLAAATDAAERALAARETLGDVMEAAKADMRLGCILMRRGSVTSAREHLARARTFWDRLGNNRRLAECLLASSRLELEVDDARSAESLARAALRACEETGWTDGVADAHTALLRAVVRTSDADGVLRQLGESQRVTEGGIDPMARVELVLAQASALRFCRHLDRSLALLDELAGTEDPLLVSRRLLERACTLRALGRSAEARTDAAAAVEHAKGREDLFLTARAALLEAQILLDLGSHEEAEPKLRALRAVCERLSDALGVALCLQELGRVARARGKDGEAEECFAASHRIRGRLGDYHGIAVLDDLRTRR